MSEEHVAPWQELRVWKVDVIMKDLRKTVLEAVALLLGLIFQLTSPWGLKHVIQHILRSSSDETHYLFGSLFILFTGKIAFIHWGSYRA